jgi:hypothetical protein
VHEFCCRTSARLRSSMSEASMGDRQVDAVGNSDSGEDDLLSDGDAGSTGDNEEAEVTQCCVCTRTFED